jgi:hypothetical protein
MRKRDMLSGRDLTKDKRCTCCGDVKNPEEFGRRQHKNYVSLASWCKKCTVSKATEGRRNGAKKAKSHTQYYGHAGTPSLLGIALGIAPIPHEYKGRQVCSQAHGSRERVSTNAWARMGEL